MATEILSLQVEVVDGRVLSLLTSLSMDPRIVSLEVRPDEH